MDASDQDTRRTATPQDPRWRTDLGTIQGWADPDAGVLRATGIRYATAQRFAPPEPVTAATAAPDGSGVIDATRWSPACPQVRVPLLEEVVGQDLSVVEIDEDCLRVSVTVPADLAPGESLPVMVWIHGGSYISGYGDARAYDPALLVTEQRVVVVAVTYRLGLFGYLSDVDGEPANLGLLDQLEALRWVQRHIAAFGGDPARVTAFGQSAGGDAVAHLMVSGGAALMQRAIIQSAPFGITRERSEMTALMRSTAAGLLDVSSTVEDVLAAQRQVERAVRRFGARGAMAFGVQYGVDPVPAEAEVDAAWQAVAPQVDVLAGCTAREASLFVDRIPPLRRARQVRGLSSVIERRVVAPVTDGIYGKGTRRFVERHRAAGGHAQRYTLTWEAPDSPYAATHIVDVPLLLGGEAWRGTPLIAGAPWEQVQAKGVQLRAMWGDFARTGQLAPVEVPDLITIHD